MPRSVRTTAYSLRTGSKTYVMAKSLCRFTRSSTGLVLPMGVEPTTAILETAALTIELRKLGFAYISISVAALFQRQSISRINPQPWRSYGKSIVRSRQRIFSKLRANDGKASRPRRRLSGDSALCMGIRSCSKNSAAMTHVHAVQDAAFKKCCLRTGRYDGSQRKHYFRG